MLSTAIPYVEGFASVAMPSTGYADDRAARYPPCSDPLLCRHLQLFAQTADVGGGQT